MHLPLWWHLNAMPTNKSAARGQYPHWRLQMVFTTPRALHEFINEKINNSINNQYCSDTQIQRKHYALLQQTSRWHCSGAAAAPSTARGRSCRYLCACRYGSKAKKTCAHKKCTTAFAIAVVAIVACCACSRGIAEYRRWRWELLAVFKI